jgi:class 3 adenylate cyclase
VETVTFLFTDVEGSTALLRRVGESTYARVLAGHHELIRSALAAHGGREVDSQGDGFFAVFSSPRGSVAAVLEMQHALQNTAWPGGEQVRVRIGIHCGEAEQTVTGLVGLEVHRAARIAAAAHGGQVLVSETAAALVRDWLPAAAGLADLGVHYLKDLGRPERIFQLTGAGLQSEFPPLRSLGNPAMLNNLPAQLATFIGRRREAAEACTTTSRINQLPEGLLIRVTGYGRFGLCRLHRIHAWQQLAHLREVTGDAVLLPGEVVDLAVGSGAAAFGISVGLGEQLLGLGLGLAGDLIGVLFCVADHLAGVLVGVPASLVGLGVGLRCPLLRG